MPVVAVERDLLFQGLGKCYTETEFDQLCFDFGIELDEVTTKANLAKYKDETGAHMEDVIYKIDIPANRYDLLCLEGLVRSMLIFLGKQETPVFTMTEPESEEVKASTTMFVKPNTKKIRPFVVCAVLRDLTFNEASYNSFIDLQDHLHRNICRERTLVAIGTHDLDTLEGPFTYDAKAPENICFTHLKADRDMEGKEMLDWFRTDPNGKSIKPYTDIIYDSPVYPVITDKNGVVLSLPPIINGKHSRITLDTKNVFIECTATDLTKAKIVLNTVVAMFSRYCKNPDSVEKVEVIYEVDGRKEVYPEMDNRTDVVRVEQVNSVVGIDIDADKVASLCSRMQLGPAKVMEGGKTVEVQVPPTRSDILHEIDIIEDVAIAYGYNNVQKTVPVSHTPGRELPINLLSDMLRFEIARASYTEILSLGLCSREENFTWLNREDDPNGAVSLSNPKTKEYQVVRTTLIPGILKTLRENRQLAMSEGIRMFEVSDVVLIDPTEDTGARNERHLCTMYAGVTDGMEVIHGMVDRLMQLLCIVPSKEYSPDAHFTDQIQGLMKDKRAIGEYKLAAHEEGIFFPGRGAKLLFRRFDSEAEEFEQIGIFGALHPSVLTNFELRYPCSILEMSIQQFAQ